jgi:hypothetical protein
MISLKTLNGMERMMIVMNYDLEIQFADGSWLNTACISDDSETVNTAVVIALNKANRSINEVTQISLFERI